LLFPHLLSLVPCHKSALLLLFQVSHRLSPAFPSLRLFASYTAPRLFHRRSALRASFSIDFKTPPKPLLSQTTIPCGPLTLGYRLRGPFPFPQALFFFYVFPQRFFTVPTYGFLDVDPSEVKSSFFCFPPPPFFSCFPHGI